MVDVALHLAGGAVEVIVDDVGAAVVDRRRGDDLQLRIFGLDGVVELGEAFFVAAWTAVEIVFVADFDVGELEGFGVAVGGAAGAPVGAGVAGDVLDFIEGVLDVGLEVVAGGDVRAVETDSRRRRRAPAACSGLRTSREIRAGPCRRWSGSPRDFCGRDDFRVGRWFLSS